MAGRTFIINKVSVLTLKSSPPVLPPHIYATLSNALGRLLPLRLPLTISYLLSPLTFLERVSGSGSN